MRAWIGALALLAAGGCAAPKEAPLPEPEDPYVWTLVGGAKGRTVLHYGADGLRFECADGSGAVSFTTPLRPQDEPHAPGARWQAAVLLEVADLAVVYPVEAETGETEAIGRGQAEADHPVLTAFAESGEIVVDGVMQAAESRAERADIRRFFDVCD